MNLRTAENELRSRSPKVSANALVLEAAVFVTVTYMLVAWLY